MSKSTKRSFTIQEKLMIIKELEKGVSQVKVRAQMGLSKSTISNIWKNREKILNDRTVNDQKKKMRLSLHPRVDKVLFEWFQQQRANNFPVSGPILQTKAEEFGKVIGENFKCTSGWLDRFKKRHKIAFRKICSLNVDSNVVVTGFPDTDPLKEEQENNNFEEDKIRVTTERLSPQFVCCVNIDNRIEEFPNMDLVKEEPEEVQENEQLSPQFGSCTNVDNNVIASESPNMIFVKEEPEERGETAVTTEDAINCIETLQRYFLQREDNIGILPQLNNIKLILENDFNSHLSV